ncbi:hypothetical protein IWW52_001381 [Coemansia sp. RSA 2704]|nr:hypothetical protein IWW52_001381 [Coemansia sp. RSA 2704]
MLVSNFTSNYSPSVLEMFNPDSPDSKWWWLGPNCKVKYKEATEKGLAFQHWRDGEGDVTLTKNQARQLTNQHIDSIVSAQLGY